MGRRKKGEGGETAPKKTTLQDLDEDQQFQLLKHHREKYEDVLKAKKAADAKMKNVCKIIKSDLGADGLRMIKMAIDLDTDPAALARVQGEVENTFKVARWMGVEIGTQFAMELEGANHFFDEGRRAGLAGAIAKPPEQLAPGSDHYNDWLAGHADGQAVLAKGFKAPEGVPREEWKAGMADSLAKEGESIKQTAAKRASDAVGSLAH